MAVSAGMKNKGKYIAKYQFKSSVEFRALASRTELQSYVRKYFAK